MPTRQTPQNTPPGGVPDDAADPVESVLTEEERDGMTPDEVLRLLQEGNARFVADDLTARDRRAQIRLAAQGQFPKAIVLSCVDSRVPVEDVFDRGIGDMFVARVAGNFVNTDILGSMEFACRVSGAKLIVVLGHERCGAIKGAIDGVELGNITEMLKKVRPAVSSVSGFEGDRGSENESFVRAVAEENVRLNLARISAESPILAEMAAAGEIAIVGALYCMDDGRVELL